MDLKIQINYRYLLTTYCDCNFNLNTFLNTKLKNFDIVAKQMNENIISIKEITSSSFTMWSE